MSAVEKRSILFVDDEPNLLVGLKRSLHAYRNLWDMAFVAGGAEALAFMDQEPVDVILTDFRMAGMTGLELLEEVKTKHPQVIRILFSGEVDKSLIMKSVKIAHQFISKPCRADRLKEKIDQTISLRHVLEDDALRSILTRIDSLPSLPALYGEILAELREPSPCIGKVGQIIASDLAMSSKILQLVNSAFFGLRQRVTSPERATLLLGIDTVQSLVLSFQIFSQFDLSKTFHSQAAQLWRHSLNTGQLAKNIAQKETQSREAAEHAFMAGLLHDCGRLVMLASFPQEMTAIMDQKPSNPIEFLKLEQAAFGVSHAPIGAYLLGLWGIPSPITHAIALHHTPGAANEDSFSVLTAVHVADFFEHCGQAGGSGGGIADAALDSAYLARIGCAGLIAGIEAA